MGQWIVLILQTHGIMDCFNFANPWDNGLF